jgi:hypothetical protein
VDRQLRFFLALQLVWMLSPARAANQASAIPPASTAAKTNGIAASTAVPSSTAAAPTPAAPKPAYLLYTYYGDRYRDPFLPLTGEFRGDQVADRPPQISSLMLKGIIQDQKSRVALLTSGVSSYILKGGRLYDGRNRMMKGISGVIKTGSVVLMGSDRTIRELRVTPTL